MPVTSAHTSLNISESDAPAQLLRQSDDPLAQIDAAHVQLVLGQVKLVARDGGLPVVEAGVATVNRALGGERDLHSGVYAWVIGCLALCS